MAEHLACHGELSAPNSLLEKLERISTSTVGRILRRIRQDEPRLPRRRSPRKPKWIQEIPAKRIPWNTTTPGHFEVDLVHHCGPTAAGEYMCTLQMIDIATGWSERVAVLGRSYAVMEHAFRTILHRLPFPVLEIHPDNGSEFLNHHMKRFWGSTVQGVELSRSRRLCRNDNRHVEQKNSTLVRAYLGHERLDSVVQTLAVNQLYDNMWIYYNLFQPVMRLVEKQVLGPIRITRRHDQARTPFDRLCSTDAVLPEHQELLAATREQVNPRLLRKQIYAAIDDIFALPGAAPGVSEDVHKTLVPTPGAGDCSVRLSFDRTIALR